MGKILIPKETPDWKQILSDTEGARDTAVSAKNTAVAARDDAVEAATDIGALGGIDGTVQTTSDLPSSTGSGDYYYVVDQAEYYKDTGSGTVQGGWTQSGPDLASLDKAQVFIKQQQFDSGLKTRGDVMDDIGSIYINGKGQNTITVDAQGGADYTSLQAAIDDVVPLIFRKNDFNIKIDVAAGTSYNEDIKIGPYIGGSVVGSIDAGPHLEISGDNSVNSVEVNSIFCGNIAGLLGPVIRGITLKTETPFVNESVAFAAQSCTDVRFTDGYIRPDNAPLNNGFVSYNSTLRVGCDFGIDLVEDAFVTKRFGALRLEDSCTGNTQSNLFELRAGGIIRESPASNTLTSTNGRVKHRTKSGVYFDESSGKTEFFDLKVNEPQLAKLGFTGSNQNIAANSTQKIAWDDTIFDEGIVDRSSNTKPEVKKDGRYIFDVKLTWDSVPVAERYDVSLNINGNEKELAFWEANGGEQFSMNLKHRAKLNSGDSFSVDVTNNSGTDSTINKADSVTSITVQRVL